MALQPCKECGNQISTSVAACPQCGAPVAPQKKKVGRRDYILGGLCLFGLGYFVILGAEKGQEQTLTAPANSNAYTTPQPRTYALPANAPAQPSYQLSSQQQEFIDIVEGSRRSYNAGHNEMAKGASRPTRARSLCDSMRSTSVNNWVGTISRLSSNSDGDGVLSISIAKDITFKTWNNSFSDISDNTLLKPDSPVFRRAQALSQGQKVRFSGALMRDRTDCFRESSMSMGGSMTDPEYIFRFTSLEPL